jgi:DNA polymerase-1
MRSPTISELVRAAVQAGAEFRLRGAQVGVGNAKLVDPEVMAALREARNDLWAYMGGRELDQPPLDLMARQFAGIRIVVPKDQNEARAAVAQLQADADRHANGLLGLDIETAANEGEEVLQPVKITRDGIVIRRPALDPLPIRRPNRPASTAALDPYRSTVRLLQLYGGGDTCLVLDTRLVPLAALAPLLKRRKMVIHNAAFELAFLAHARIAVPQLECSMQVAGLLLGVHRRSLDDAALHYLHIDLPKELQTSDWGATVLSPGQIAYAALDAIVALKLWSLLRDAGLRSGRFGAYSLQRDCIPATVRMQARGLLLDRDAHRKQIERWAVARSDARHAFTERTGNPPPKTPAQIRGLLGKVLPEEMLQEWPRTEKSGVLSTSDNDLKRCSHLPEIALVRTINAQEKLLSAFGAPLAARAGPDGRLRASFNLAGAKTGRMRCSNPNMQQLPRDPAFRNCFIAAPGNVLIVGDYSMMELRAAAEISNDAVLRKDFADGVDLHRRLAAQTFGIAEEQVTKEQRQAAKPINFGTIYGAGGAGLAKSAWDGYGVRMTPEEAAAARDRFLGRYRDLATWMRTNADACQQRGFIPIGKHGRVILAEWEMPPDSGGSAYQRAARANGDECAGEAEDDADDDDPFDTGPGSGCRRPDARPPSPLKYTLCCNAPVQGACAEITMLAMTLIDRAMSDAGIAGGLVLAVHDELVLEVPENRAAEAVRLLAACMTKAFKAYFNAAPVTKLVDVHPPARSWGAGKST